MDFPEDLRPAASTPAVTLDSAGEKLPGVLHLPAGPGPFPAVVLLHGFPGNERNFDLAQALRRAGYAALVFHYRGSWGAAGTWSWQHVLQDAATVVTQLRANATAAGKARVDAPGDVARVWVEARIDPARIAVVGHSVGGFAALHTAAADPAVGAVASLAGFDLAVLAAATHADPAARAEWVAIFEKHSVPVGRAGGG